MPTNDYHRLEHFLLDWAETSGNREITFRDIDLEVARALYEELNSRGFNIRFNWSVLDRRAEFKMATGIHELPGSWFNYNLAFINERIALAAPCGSPSVVEKGTAYLQLEGRGRNQKFPSGRRGGSEYQPDGSLYLQYPDPSTGLVSNIGDMPRVAVECAFSQKVELALDKTCDYLHFSPGKGIHAVIICDIDIADDDTLRARMSLWIRAPTGDFDKDYPLDPCRLGRGETHKYYPKSSDTDTVSSNSQALSELPDSDVYFASGDTAKRFPIYNRSGWKHFVRSDSIPEDKTFTLNFYDFVRLCESQPEELIPLECQEIELKLGWLKDQLKAEIPVYRGRMRTKEPITLKHRQFPADFLAPRRLRDFVKKLTRKNNASAPAP